MASQDGQAAMSTAAYEQAVRDVLEEFGAGGTLATLRGLTADHLEAIYSIGYNLFNQNKLEDALKIYEFLCVYNHYDKRFWKGLAATRQLLKRYDSAAQAYAMMGLLDLTDPTAPLHAADCYLALGDKEQAVRALEAAVEVARDKPEHAGVFHRAETLLAALKVEA